MEESQEDYDKEILEEETALDTNSTYGLMKRDCPDDSENIS